MDLTIPRNPLNILVHQRKEFWEGFRSTEVVLCLENLWPLVSVSRNMADMGYKIIRASVELLGPYRFLKGKANKTEDINVGEDESEKIFKILDVATERGCPKVNVQLIVSGPSEVLLHYHLMRSLTDVVVTGGQVYRDGGEFGTRLSFPSGDLLFFVTDKPEVGAG